MEEKKPKIISAVITTIFMLLVVLICLSFGYDPPDPPIPEEGVEVNLGNSDFGSGDDPMPSAQSSAPSTPAPQNQVVTQNTESSTPMPTSARPTTSTSTKPAEPPPTETKPKEPEINKNALFTGRRNQGSNGSGDGSQGVTSGQGDQGKPGGTQSSNNYVGNGGGNGNFSLVGRSSVSLPKPEYSSNNQGTVVVQIWVDRQGRVIRAEYQPKGSNTSNGYLVEQAKAAAMRAKFNPDASAPEEQKGTITYIFRTGI